jgi:hypothetical protein
MSSLGDGIDHQLMLSVATPVRLLKEVTTPSIVDVTSNTSCFNALRTTKVTRRTQEFVHVPSLLDGGRQ